MMPLMLAMAAVLQGADTCGSCGKETYGTSIEWEGSPSAAAKRAAEEKKLVFVLHVSGNFEDPDFT